MTTPNLNPSQEQYWCTPQFEQDLNGKGHSLLNDGAQYENDINLMQEARTDAIDAAMNVDMKKYKGNPGALLILLMVKVFGEKRDTYYQLQLKTEADAVQIQADFTKLSNDIQNTVNAGGTSSPSAGGGISNANDIVHVAAETDEMQKILSMNVPKNPTGQNLGIEGVQNALGATPCSLMDGNFEKMRKDIYWGEDPNGKIYNPTQVVNPTTQTRTYHFDANGSATGYIHSYAQMKQELSGQGEEGQSAQNANKILLDAYNQNVSTTQSLGTAFNSEVGLTTSKIKSNTSFLSDLSQDILTGNRTAVKNQIVQ